MRSSSQRDAMMSRKQRSVLMVLAALVPIVAIAYFSRSDVGTDGVYMRSSEVTSDGVVRQWESRRKGDCRFIPWDSDGRQRNSAVVRAKARR